MKQITLLVDVPDDFIAADDNILVELRGISDDLEWEHTHFRILPTADAATHSGEAVAWLHTMHMECGQKDVRASTYKDHNWGEEGIHYDASYRITSEPLTYLAQPSPAVQAEQESYEISDADVFPPKALLKRDDWDAKTRKPVQQPPQAQKAEGEAIAWRVIYSDGSKGKRAYFDFPIPAAFPNTELLYTKASQPTAARVPDGWKLAPLIATKAMFEAARKDQEHADRTIDAPLGYGAIWSTMIAAAPAQSEEGK